MRLKLPAIPLIVGRRRVLAATLAHQRFPAHILVLDDGFQHLPLRKDLTILLDPPTSNSSCLPAGPYREPKSNRTRADLCLPDQFQLKRRIASLAQVNGEEMTTPTHATALCAIAQPDKFVESLGARGISVTRLIALSDHNPLTEGTLMLPDDPSEAVVVTEKDWVKLRDRADLGQRQIWIAIEEATIEPAKEFRDWLASKLDAIKAKGA
jgi:tetraacyldisaccharide 4'-kinase